jgi:hypothetical protein
MDDRERIMCRERARWRARRKGQSLASLWGYENWASEGKEDHHIAREKYGGATMPVPISMHRELTRRQIEEHPPEGPDPRNPLETKGRLALGLADIIECLADGLRQIGENRIDAAGRGARDLDEATVIPEELAALMRLVSGRLMEIALHKTLDLEE